MISRALLALALCFCGLAVAADLSDRSQTLITSVLQRGNAFIAATNDGLYRSSLPDQVWQKIPTPADLPTGGSLAQQSDESPRLAYYTGDGLDFIMPGRVKPALFLSDDAGATWRRASLPGNITDVFLHPDGSIYAVTWHETTTPFPPGGDSISWVGPKGENEYPSVHLVVSSDRGKTWRDITPPIRAAFGLWGIFRDPDHPGLVCVKSNEISHISRTLIYQAYDTNYNWLESHGEDWHGGSEIGGGDFPWRFQPNGGDMPAYLDNFFKYPFPRSGNHPDIPTKYLTHDQPAYRFHAHQPMSVTITTVFISPDPAIKWLDNKDPTVFWYLRLKSDSGLSAITTEQTADLNTTTPARPAAAYLADPNLTTAQVDQAHPYRSTIDLARLYPISQPGKYRVQLIHDDERLLRDTGSAMSTEPFDIEVLP